MTNFKPALVLAVLSVAVCMVTSCSELMPSSGSSPTPSASATRSPVGPPSKLGAAVPMPDGFPTDFPVYTGSRLTQTSRFNSNGTTTWGMEWQTLDGPAKVKPFFVARLDQGDWMLLTSSGTATSFSATFRRRSDAKTTGTLSAGINGGVTRIAVVLTTSP